MSRWESSGKTDEWYTPGYIFDALQCRFDMDVAAPIDRTFCSVPADDFIVACSTPSIWNGFVWCNPPFGGRNAISKWLDGMDQHHNGIALTPDRTSAPWWQKAARECDAILFISGKVKFIRADGSTGDSPSTGTTLLAYGHKAVEALKRAHENNLGFLTIKPL